MNNKRYALAACLLTTVMFAGCSTAKIAEPDFATLIAHRGESFDAPENTLVAYKTAVDRGFGFECDIYLSKDKKVFTFHDRTLTRTTGGSNTNACGDVDWNTISKLDVGSWGKWKRSKFAGTRPALLEEVLELAIDGRFIYVEVKTGPEIVPYVKEVFASQKKATPDNTLFISFNIESCRELKRLMPEYKVYWLSSCRKKVEGNYLPMSAEEILYYLNYAKVNGLDCRFDRANITREFISKIKSAGYECHVWTIDSLNTALEAFNRGAQTVTTNRAKFLLESYNKKKGEKGGCSSK